MKRWGISSRIDKAQGEASWTKSERGLFRFWGRRRHGKERSKFGRLRGPKRRIGRKCFAKLRERRVHDSESSRLFCRRNLGRRRGGNESANPSRGPKRRACWGSESFRAAQRRRAHSCIRSRRDRYRRFDHDALLSLQRPAASRLAQSRRQFGAASGRG